MDAQSFSDRGHRHTLDVYLEDEMQPIVQTLVERIFVVIREVELSPKTEVARVEHIY